MISIYINASPTWLNFAVQLDLVTGLLAIAAGLVCLCRAVGERVKAKWRKQP